MAEVHRGRDMRLGRDVAIKILRADLARDPSFLNRFRREAQSAAGLNHPAIVAVYDTGEDHRRPTAPRCRSSSWSTSRDGRCATSSRPRAGCRARRAMEITAEVCAALDFSHRNGIDPPRHQAGERDDHPGRRGQGHGLRHRPRAGRQRRDRHPDRSGDRHRAVPLARAGPGRGRRRPLRRLLDRLPAVRAAHRAARRSRATRRSRWPTSTSARTRRRRRRSTPPCRPRSTRS